MPKGWLKDDTNNQTAIRNEEQKLRIYPCNFCSYTANPYHSPTNLTQKGSAADSDTYRNAQLELFSGPEVLVGADLPRETKYKTLVLGMNFEGENAKAELSFPVEFTGQKYKRLSIRVPLLDGTKASPEPRRESDHTEMFDIVDIAIGRKL